jgi:hypothetical protein
MSYFGMKPADLDCAPILVTLDPEAFRRNRTVDALEMSGNRTTV